MYLVSHSAGWGRNFGEYVHNGTVHIDEGRRRTKVEINGGFVVERTVYEKDECTILRYGQGLTTKKASKTIKQVYYDKNSLQAIRKGSLWKKETGVQLCGSRGTLECYSTSNGAYGREVFTYGNGKVAYIASRWRKNLIVNRPSGKPWIVVEGKVQLNNTPIAERLNHDDSEIPFWYLMRGQDWKMTVYDSDGKTAITQGQVQNRQKQGKWLVNGKDMYYLSGVSVSRQLYEEDPEKWDGHEVLKIANAQLRCSLLNRMGYDRLLEKTGARQIDESKDDGQLLEIDTSVSNEGFGSPDRIMRLLKVTCPSTGQIYVLRVPSDINNCQQARQWTFGLRRESINDGRQLELIKET